MFTWYGTWQVSDAGHVIMQLASQSIQTWWLVCAVPSPGLWTRRKNKLGFKINQLEGCRHSFLWYWQASDPGLKWKWGCFPSPLPSLLLLNTWCLQGWSLTVVFMRSNTKTVKFPAENCYEKIRQYSKSKLERYYLKSGQRGMDACRPLEARSRAHGGSVKCQKVGKKPKGEGLLGQQYAS